MFLAHQHQFKKDMSVKIMNATGPCFELRMSRWRQGSSFRNVRLGRAALAHEGCMEDSAYVKCFDAFGRRRVNSFCWEAELELLRSQSHSIQMVSLVLRSVGGRPSFHLRQF